MADEHGITPDERLALQDFVAHVRGGSLSKVIEFKMDAAGTKCGCIASFVWKTDERLGKWNYFSPGDYVAKVGMRSRRLERLFRYESPKGTEGDMTRVTAAMAADACERVLAGKEPWPIVEVLSETDKYSNTFILQE